MRVRSPTQKSPSTFPQEPTSRFLSVARIVSSSLITPQPLITTHGSNATTRLLEVVNSPSSIPISFCNPTSSSREFDSSETAQSFDHNPTFDISQTQILQSRSHTMLRTSEISVGPLDHSPTLAIPHKSYIRSQILQPRSHTVLRTSELSVGPLASRASHSMLPRCSLSIIY